MPIIVTVAVLQYFAIYGDFVIARVLLRSTDNLTVMVGLLLFQTQRFEQDWGIITAGAVLATLPVVIIYVRRRQGLIPGRFRVGAGRRRSEAIPAHGSGRPYNRQP